MGQTPSQMVKSSLVNRHDDRIQSLMQSGKRHRQNKDYEQARKQYAKALDNIIKKKHSPSDYYDELLFQIYLDISRCHRKLLQVDEANYYCRLAENISKQMRNKLSYDDSLNSISDFHLQRKSDSSEFDADAINQIRVVELRNYELAIGTLYGKIGKMYFSQCKYHEALHTCKTAIKIQAKLGCQNKVDIATLHDIIGHIYKMKSMYNDALSHYQLSLHIRREIKETSKLDMANCYENIAEIYSRQRKLKEALLLYETSRTLRQQILGDDAIEIKHSNGRISKVLYLQDKYTQS